MHAKAGYFGNSEYVACLGNIFDRNFAAQLCFVWIFAVQQMCTCEMLGVRSGTFYTKIGGWRAISGVFRIIREFWGKFCLIERNDVLCGSDVPTCRVSMKFISGQHPPSKIVWERFTATVPRLPGKVCRDENMLKERRMFMFFSLHFVVVHSVDSDSVSVSASGASELMN